MVLLVTFAMVFVTKLTKTEPEIKEIQVPMIPSHRSPGVCSSTVILKDDGGSFESAHSRLLEICLPRPAVCRPSALTQPFSVSPTANHKLPNTWTASTRTRVADRRGVANGPIPTRILNRAVWNLSSNLLTFSIWTKRNRRRIRRAFRRRKMPAGPSSKSNAIPTKSGISIVMSNKNQDLRYALAISASLKHRLSLT